MKKSLIPSEKKIEYPVELIKAMASFLDSQKQ